jgi:hypothetical protein
MREDHLEQRYTDYMRHHFSCHTDIEEVLERKQALMSRLTDASLLLKKRSLFEELSLTIPRESREYLHDALELIDRQDKHLSTVSLLIPDRDRDVTMPKQSLLHHEGLLKKHFDTTFVDLKNAIVLGDPVDEDDLKKASSAVIDAAHLEQLQIVLGQQKRICSTLRTHIVEGGSHRIDATKKLLLQSFDEELFRISAITHQPGIKEYYFL